MLLYCFDPGNDKGEPMQPPSKEQDRQRRFAAIGKLRPHGFYPVGGWLFVKNGKCYDLSAADLDQIEGIEREGLFIVPEEMTWNERQGR